MGPIQSSINSMVGSASRAVMAVKAYSVAKQKKAAALQKQQATAQKQAAKKAAPATPAATQTSPQQVAAQAAKQSSRNEVNAKKTQRRDFRKYLAQQSSSLGKIGNLPENVQKEIAKQYTPSMRRRLMDAADKEAKNGKHR